MNDRDDELDRLLKPLAKLQPRGRAISRWQSLAFRKSARQGWPAQVTQWAAAAAVGFAIGAWAFKNQQPNQSVADNFDAGATIETTYSNSY